VISRSKAQTAGPIDVEETHLGAAAFVAVANDHDRVFRHQHLVVPRVAWINVGTERINRRDGFQRAIANRHREQAAAAQDHEVVPVQFDDAAFVDSGVLRVGD
jgi:hypothetical protein